MLLYKKKKKHLHVLWLCFSLISSHSENEFWLYGSTDSIAGMLYLSKYIYLRVNMCGCTYSVGLLFHFS